MKLTFLSFWGINAPLDADALCRQMDDMRCLGLDGVVFHPRNYPGEPAYLSQAYMDILSQVILHAKATGMIFWLYDEDGWPSGTAGGQVTAEHPEYCIQVLHEDLSVTQTPGVDPLQPGAAKVFIRLTHERYAAMLQKEAFDYVTGFFTDEVAFSSHGCSISEGCVPWCDGMPEHFRSALLFQDVPEGIALRKAYWTYVTDLLQQRFYQPIRRWCDAHGKLFTGHLKGEENPYFQVSFSGSAISSLQGFSLPGIDALERQLHHSCFLRLPASLSLQFGDGHAMGEVMGGSGWGTSPQDEERYLLTLAKAGVDTFVLHLQHFRLDEKAMTDWPPSRPCDLTWREAYPEMLRRVRHKADKFDSRRAADALIVMPARGVMGGFIPAQSRCVNEHDGDELPDVPAARDSLALLAMTDVLQQFGWFFDLTDEMTYERHAKASDQGICLGQRQYDQVLLSSGADLPCTMNTPVQSGWHTVAWQGDKRIPDRVVKKDDRHFLCTFHAPSEQPDDPGNLIASGYGFCPWVTLEKDFRLESPRAASTLLLTGIDGAAASLVLDGQSLGCIYGPDWSLPLPSLEAGQHRLQVRLYNSGYNVHGPHHYYLGDYGMTSPLHIAGQKHFGDPPDAPEYTHIPQWHFVNFRLFGHIHLLTRPLREV